MGSMHPIMVYSSEASLRGQRSFRVTHLRPGQPPWCRSRWWHAGLSPRGRSPWREQRNQRWGPTACTDPFGGREAELRTG
jgi:hypothetical protein